MARAFRNRLRLTSSVRTSLTKMGFTGKGVRIGIIDTGIDYTHAMLGGSGNPDDYKNVDPSKPTPLFPNKKVVGGTDLVGSDYDASSELPSAYIPNPTTIRLTKLATARTSRNRCRSRRRRQHVLRRRSDAQLYAIKVFGKEGSTSTAAVLAAFEYAANPKGDLNPNDQLDAVNLSLGGLYGTPHILYDEAVRNLSRAGTAVIAAAGNSGPQDFVVGAPGTAIDAISVAASVDGSPVNWQFAASILTIAGKPVVVKAIEGNLTRPVAKSDGIQGKLVDIGLADQTLSDAQKAKLKGNVALITRGGNPFEDKLKIAVGGGAIGAVVMNNQDGDPAPMGGKAQLDIPGIMVTQDLGKQITAAMAGGDVTIVFKSSQTIQDPDLIDTIASFSSKGPRSEDDLIKPEIAAPGASILSAAMGKGTEGVRFDGTSMATPHMTGVYALLKQAHKDLSVAQIKSLLMNSGLQLHDPSKTDYPVSLQGAGRVQIVPSLMASVLAAPSISLGLIQSSADTAVVKQIPVTNISDQTKTLQVSYQGSTYLTISGPTSITLKPKETQNVAVKFTIHGLDTKNMAEEVDGHVVMKTGSETLEIPALAMRVEISDLQASGIQGGNLVLKNGGIAPGMVLPFNLLGQGTPKQPVNPSNSWMSTTCNLKTAGYRIVTSKDDDGKQATYLQFAYELYQPLSNWTYCEINVLFDKDGDGKPDLELAGVYAPTMFGASFPYQNASVLINAEKMRDIRSDYETKLRQGLPVAPPNYVPSIMAIDAMMGFPDSTVAVMQVDISKLGISNKTVGIHVSTSDEDSDNVLRSDDFLTKDFQQLSLDPASQAYTDLPQIVPLAPGEQGALPLTRGQGTQPLLVLYPNNHSGSNSQIFK